MALSRKWSVMTLAPMLLMIAMSGVLGAQERDEDPAWWEWAAAEVLSGQEVRTSEGRTVMIGPEGRFDTDRDRRLLEEADEGIPAFCRTGEGHPVFGRSWCIEKGFGLGRGGWRRGGIGDIIFRRGSGPDGTILDRSGIEEVLGEVILGRMLESSPPGRRAAPLTARWLELEEPAARVLQIRSGDRPLAELTDLDLDGTVDVTLWSETEGGEEEGQPEEERRGPPR